MANQLLRSRQRALQRVVEPSTSSKLRFAPSPLTVVPVARRPSSVGVTAWIHPLSTSSRVLDRPPTFTTPEPSSLPPQPAHDASKPLPPTDLPVEDYGSPLLHTASFFGNLFRYAVYGSVTIVLVAVGSLVGVHMYVEHVELAKGDATSANDPDEWAAELEGWSGAHRGGGTDPRLGVFARSAIRGAWIAQNWGVGTLSEPLVPSTPASMSTPFAGAGGMMIGTAQERHDAIQTGLSHGEIRDAGWQLAEDYLVYALARCAKNGISLIGGASSNEASAPADVDRAALELEQRLAGIRERIGGRYRLEAAREAWERIYYALSSSREAAALAPSSTSEWIQRERLRATRKLGELSARLGEMARAGSEERELENIRAEGWFLGGILPALVAESPSGARELRKSTKQMEVEQEKTKSVSPSSSFFGFWSRSHPPAKPTTPASTVALSTSSDATTILPEISRAVDLLERGKTRHASPATQRALLSSLISLETFLARRRSLPAAHAVQSASLSYAESLMGPSSLPSPSTSSGGPTLTSSTPSAILGPTLTYHFCSTRAAVLRTHLAEVSLALRMPNIESYALGLLDSAIHSCDSALVALGQSPLVKDSSSKVRPYSKAAQALVRDARVTATMACNLSGFVLEMGSRIGPDGKKEETKAWAEGGVKRSQTMFAKALGFGKDENGNVVDEKGSKLAEQGLQRAKDKLALMGSA